MKRFCKFELHEYMDAYPQEHIRVFGGESEEDIENNCREFAKGMTNNYSGGPTKFIKIMSTEEAKAHIDTLTEYEKQHPQPDSEEFLSNMNELYNECYG